MVPVTLALDSDLQRRKKKSGWMRTGRCPAETAPPEACRGHSTSANRSTDRCTTAQAVGRVKFLTWICAVDPLSGSLLVCQRRNHVPEGIRPPIHLFSGVCVFGIGKTRNAQLADHNTQRCEAPSQAESSAFPVTCFKFSSGHRNPAPLPPAASHRRGAS